MSTILGSQDRINKTVKTPASLSKLNQNKTNLYDKIKKHKIVEELRQRNVKFLSTLPAKELKSFFDFEMHGIQRRPTLLFGQSNVNLQSLHLESYKILTRKLLHEFMNNFKNLYEELSLHLHKEKKKKSCVTSSILLLMQKKLRTAQITEKVSHMSPLG